MGLFGKSEEELKKIAAGLDKRQTALDNREIDLQRQEAVMTHSAEMLKGEKDAFEQERKAFVDFTAQERQKLAQERQDFLSEIAAEREKLSHENAELMRRKEELCQKEAEFKAGYAEQQVDVIGHDDKAVNGNSGIMTIHVPERFLHGHTAGGQFDLRAVEDAGPYKDTRQQAFFFPGADRDEIRPGGGIIVFP